MAESPPNFPGMPGSAAPEPSSARLIGTLGIAGFFSGVLLVVVYLVTLPVIEANRAEALRVAIYQVLPGCKSFKTLELKDGRLVEKKAEAGGSGAREEKPVPQIFSGFNESGELLGFAIPASEPGFQDVISGIFGYDAKEKVIIGFEVLESKETPGLGDKIMKDEKFKANFVALAVEPEIAAAKPGEKSQPNQVETITGATISSKAVIRSLQKGIDAWRPAIEGYLESNRISINKKMP